MLYGNQIKNIKCHEKKKTIKITKQVGENQVQVLEIVGISILKTENCIIKTKSSACTVMAL